jgi:hypothetical protein
MTGEGQLLYLSGALAGGCKALVSVSGYLKSGSQAVGKTPLPPKAELQWWYQYYFATERDREGSGKYVRDFGKLIWQFASPKWNFDDAKFDRRARAFENPDDVAVAIHNEGDANRAPHCDGTWLRRLFCMTALAAVADKARLQDAIVPGQEQPRATCRCARQGRPCTRASACGGVLASIPVCVPGPAAHSCRTAPSRGRKPRSFAAPAASWRPAAALHPGAVQPVVAHRVARPWRRVVAGRRAAADIHLPAGGAAVGPRPRVQTAAAAMSAPKRKTTRRRR